MDSHQISKHLAAGAQLSVARYALNELASTLELMSDSDNYILHNVRTLCGLLDTTQTDLINQLKAEAPEVQDIAIKTLYESPPPFSAAIFPNSRPEANKLYAWLSNDFQRAAISVYLLAQPCGDQYEPIAVVPTSGQAEAYLAREDLRIEKSWQVDEEVLFNIKQHVPVK